MANLKAIRKRIQGVRGTQQLTRAMKLVAAAKLRKAQEQAVDNRPAVDALASILEHLSRRLREEYHPLLVHRPVRRVMLIAFASDRGMCGTFNVNIGKQVLQFVQDHTDQEHSVTIAAVGKKVVQYLKQRNVAVHRHFDNLFGEVSYERCSEIGADLSAHYLAGDYDEAYVLFNWFRSPVAQVPLLRRILPVTDRSEEPGVLSPFILEPSPRGILDSLFPIYVNSQIYHGLLESVASEMGARMTAMDNASNNAQALIHRLTLAYNKARQDAITSELMDIVNGAEALRL
jgi:F-type H+-transporting ATPase subunit gamma